MARDHPLYRAHTDRFAVLLIQTAPAAVVGGVCAAPSRRPADAHRVIADRGRLYLVS
jgi:hypothetical protein